MSHSDLKWPNLREISYTFCSFSFHSLWHLTALYSIVGVVIHTPEKGLCGAVLQLYSTINQVSKSNILYKKWSLKLEIAVRVTILKTLHLCFSPKNWWAIIIFSILRFSPQAIQAVFKWYIRKWQIIVQTNAKNTQPHHTEAFVELRKIFPHHLRRNPHSNCKCAYYSNFLAVLQSVTRYLARKF